MSDANVAPDTSKDEQTGTRPPIFDDRTYDILKYVAIYVISPLSTLVMVVGSIWDVPVMQPIALTIAAIGTFLAAVIGYSNKTYQDYMDQLKQLNDAKAQIDKADESLKQLAQKTQNSPENA